ncbi:MAG: class I SAM-dependent methyltransferase [Acidimicrobiales bacterium]
MGTTKPVYDVIGADYARHRRPDPRIAAQIERALGAAATVVNVGAGAGSYEPTGPAVVAVEPSPVMVAQRLPHGPPVVRAVAEHLPFASDSFAAAMAVLTVHHWGDPVGGLGEMARVAPRVVVLMFDPAPHFRFWLFDDYVPEVRGLDSSRTPGAEAVAEVIGADRIEVVPVPADCVDGFIWAFWNRPAAYLDPAVRACTSGLAQLPSDLVHGRMERLRADLADGTWHARHGGLMEHDSIDGGFRLVVRS